MRLTMYRFVLLGLFATVVVKWVKDLSARPLLADMAVIAFCAWCMLSMFVIHGIGVGLQTGGILFIETMVPYLMGRCYVRSADDYYKALRLLFFIVLCLLPFALVEVMTGAKPLIRLFGAVLPSVEITMMQPRMGLWRTQGPFEHSILFGAVCGSIVAGVYLVLGRGKGFMTRCLMTGAVVLTGFCALSSAPIAGMMVQILLMVWNSLLRAVKARWLILVAAALTMTTVIGFGSNQGVIKWYISHFTFDGQTGWFRLLIWDLGTESVRNHPLFGIGFNEWARPAWMPGSIDNFWLLMAVRHGLPASLLFFLAFALLYGAAVRRGGLDEAAAACKLAYLICLTSFFFVSWTVHFLNAPYVLYMFIFGSGAWIGTAPKTQFSSERPFLRRQRSGTPSSATPGRRSHAMPRAAAGDSPE
ncbi:O-antigen ligase family protein [Mesorhizobium sp. CN2-181]|uniref:O-antigen ligase family protein n=1 Tax=Mesorhizobium yinganensis TaxID=3157707 RepID=UPI0032B71059